MQLDRRGRLGVADKARQDCRKFVIPAVCVGPAGRSSEPSQASIWHASSLANLIVCHVADNRGPPVGRFLAGGKVNAMIGDNRELPRIRDPSSARTRVPMASRDAPPAFGSRLCASTEVHDRRAMYA